MVLDVMADFLKIRIKSRDDTMSDQYSRLFMVKLLLVCAAIAGVSWSTDQLNCVIPGMLKFHFKENVSKYLH